MTGFLLTAKQKLMLCINKRLYRSLRPCRSDRTSWSGVSGETSGSHSPGGTGGSGTAHGASWSGWSPPAASAAFSVLPFTIIPAASAVRTLCAAASVRSLQSAVFPADCFIFKRPIGNIPHSGVKFQIIRILKIHSCTPFCVLRCTLHA